MTLFRLVRFMSWGAIGHTLLYPGRASRGSFIRGSGKRRRSDFSQSKFNRIDDPATLAFSNGLSNHSLALLHKNAPPLVFAPGKTFILVMAAGPGDIQSKGYIRAF